MKEIDVHAPGHDSDDLVQIVAQEYGEEELPAGVGIVMRGGDRFTIEIHVDMLTRMRRTLEAASIEIEGNANREAKEIPAPRLYRQAS